jgi:hypothetical protein
MPPEVIQQISTGSTQHWYVSVGAIIGYIITFVGAVWKIANLIIYLRNLYVDLSDRICELETLKRIDDIQYETIKNMIHDLRTEVHDIRKERGKRDG